MPAPARNAPCPCGSGRKHKLCCLARTDERDTAWRAANRASRSTYDTILAIATAMWPTRNAADVVDTAWEDLWLGDPPTPEPEPIEMALLAPWMAYHWCPQADDRVLAQLCMNAARRPFLAEQREWIEAAIDAPFSLLEVLEVVPGESMRVHDLLLDEERVVYERTATKSIPVRSILFASTPVFRGIATIDGLYPYTLPPGFRDELRAKVGAVIGPLSSFDRATLHEHSRELLLIFADQVEPASAPRPMPTLQNTDGELLVMCELRWTIHARKLAEVRRRLHALDTGDPDEWFEADTASSWTWSKAGNAQHSSWTNTSLGTVRIDGGTLLGECNSEGRAARLRRLVDRSCDGVVTFVGIERTTQAQMQAEAAAKQAKGARPAAKAPSKLEREAIAQFLTAHYDAWPDAPLPALAGRTPREAMRTAKGRREVDALLREMEHGTGGLEMAGLYDFGRLRRALGL